MFIDFYVYVFYFDYYDQYFYWGLVFEFQFDGDIKLCVGDWILILGVLEWKKVLCEVYVCGEMLNVVEYMVKWCDLSYCLVLMDVVGQDVQVLLVLSYCYMYWVEVEFVVFFVCIVNDVLVSYCVVVFNCLMFWVYVLLNVLYEVVKEICCVCIELGVKGLVVGGFNFGGMEYDLLELDFVWEVLCDFDLLIFVYGYNQFVIWGKQVNIDCYEIIVIVGMNYDEIKCFWYLINGGVLDCFLNLKIYIIYGGGFVFY